MDAFNKEKHKYLGTNGLHCPCCQHYHGSDQAKLNKVARHRFKEETRKAAAVQGYTCIDCGKRIYVHDLKELAEEEWVVIEGSTGLCEECALLREVQCDWGYLDDWDDDENM